MKKIVCLCLALCFVMLSGCGESPSSSPNPSAPGTQTPETNSPSTTPENQPGQSDALPSGETGPVDLDFASDVIALEGTWALSQVFAEGETKDAAADAMFLKITKELDPSELVADAAYIHNQVYNFTGHLTFGLQEIIDTLAADDVDEYKGSTGWQDFPQGKVMAEGEFFEQPGPATMRFKDIDDYGLYLDQIAGISADLDTTNKTLILGMNASGKLLLGYSEEHLERPGTEGEWVYCLIFNRAA